MELIVNPGKPDEQGVPLRSGVSRIGRDPDNDVVIARPSLSRHHAALEMREGRVVVRDLDSRNGTFVEGRRVSECELVPGSRFQCGHVIFELRDLANRQQPPTDEHTLSELLVPGGGPGVTRALRLRPAGGSAERANTKLETLLRVGRILSEPEPLPTLLRRVFDLLFLVFDVDRGALLLRPAEGGPLVPEVTLTRRGERPEGPIYSQGIVDRVLAEGVATLAMDATADPRFADSPSVGLDGIRSTMCAPLRGRDEVLGVLYVDHLSLPGHFTPEDLDFLTSFAHQAAIAVENTRLRRQLEEQAVHRSRLLRFFPSSVVGLLMASPELEREPSDHDVTVLFSDISGFTQMSSGLSSREVVKLLNRYFPPMAEIVFRHGGTLEKYIGDALMAIWGAPIAADDDAERATRAALEMLATLDRLNGEWRREPPFAIHIGLHSGPVTFGNIGSPEYVQYAAIGDTTNVASRVCGVAKAGEIILSAATRARLRSDLPLEPLPPVWVKGKDSALELYRLVRPS